MPNVYEGSEKVVGAWCSGEQPRPGWIHAPPPLPLLTGERVYAGDGRGVVGPWGRSQRCQQVNIIDMTNRYNWQGHDLYTFCNIRLDFPAINIETAILNRFLKQVGKGLIDVTELIDCNYSNSMFVHLGPGSQISIDTKCCENLVAN